ncbi:hypothetical protein [Streptomyces sp. NPDC059176]|uniref:hypothetical protein n=1 Tax=unclassified Streptomyces TaxID=2593676 RepID=UPI0036CD72C4
MATEAAVRDPADGGCADRTAERAGFEPVIGWFALPQWAMAVLAVLEAEDVRPRRHRRRRTGPSSLSRSGPRCR